MQLFPGIMFMDYLFISIIFVLFTRISVNVPLAHAATNGVSQTPFKPRNFVSTHKNRTGNTSVPDTDTSNECTGLSTAVKKDEKHISIHRVRYEIEKILIATLLTVLRVVSPCLINAAATLEPAKNINKNAATDSSIIPNVVFLKMRFIR